MAARELWRGFRLSAEMREKIDALRPLLERAGEESVAARRFPQSAVDAMFDAGLFRLAMPRELGGLELDPVSEMEAYEALARINVAAAWNVLVGNIHTAWAAAYLSDAAVSRIFPDGNRTVVAGQAAPIGKAWRVDGGFRVTGRYSWGSGVSHSSWVLGGFSIQGEDAMGVFVVPKEDVSILDNWHVIGVEGSGSYDYAVDDVFVPEGYWFDWPQPLRRRGGHRFTRPPLAQASVPHSSVALGGCARMLEEIVALAATKKRSGSPNTVADRGAFQRDLGRAFVRLNAARDNAANLFSHYLEPDQTLSELQVIELAAMGAHANELAVEIANMAFRYGGGNSIRLNSPLQRGLRDLLVAQQHVAVADSYYDVLGQLLIAQNVDQGQEGART